MDQGTLSTPLKWTKINCPDSGPRSSHTSVVYKNYIITYGGWDTGGLDHLIIFDILKQEWTIVEPSGTRLEPRYGHTMCITENEQIIIFGGRDPVVHGQVTIMTITDIEKKLVECENVEMESNKQLFRCRHTAQIFNDKMYVFGGLDKQLNSTNQLWQLDLNTFTWTQCKTSGSIPKERTSHCSAIYKGKLFVFGGFLSTAASRFNDFYMINLGIMKWQKIDTGTVNPPPMYGSSALEKDGYIFLFGGYKESGECINDVYSFDINSNEWTLVPTEGELPSVREYQTLVSFQDEFIVWGGWSNREDLVSDIYSLKVGVMKPSKPVFRASKKIFNLESLFLEKLFADVTFVVEGQEFPAHRVILAKSCNYFHNTFTSGMVESSTTRIEVKDAKASTFRSILQFIYYEKTDVDENSVLDLLILSDKYVLSELRKKCEEYLGENLTEDNVVELSKYADQLDCNILLQAIEQFNKINSQNSKQSNDSKKLPKYSSGEVSKAQ